jgi:TolB-like protein/thioredoxin-like negative regulator of GroEL
VVRDDGTDDSSRRAKRSRRRLDLLALVALVLAVAYFALDKFMLDPVRDEMREQAIVEAAQEEARAEVAEEAEDSGPPVLAVLPFTAVTNTQDSEFFAAGVHDDLLTKLAQLPSMLVISRTSVMEYRNVQRNIREIGEELGADALLEGGVQSAGNRIRINAQLIDARTDEHLWAETYDRELTAESIFDVQEDIARAIADALHITLSTPDESSPIPTSNMAAYRAYHEAVTLRDSASSNTTTDEYRELLRRASDLDPQFTRPLAYLAGSYALEAFGTKDSQAIAKVEEILERISAVAPDSADYIIAQTYYTYYVLRDYDLAHEFASRALEMMPSDTYLLSIRSWIERRQGDYDAVLETRRMTRQLEPNNPAWTASIARLLMTMHRYDEALAEADAFDGEDYGVEWLRAYLDLRNHGDLDRLVAEVRDLSYRLDGSHSVTDRWWTYIVARDFAGAREALDDFPDDREPGNLGVTDEMLAELVTISLLGETDRIPELVATMQARDPLDYRAALTLALMASIEGNTPEAERLVLHWFRRGTGTDWADRVLMRDLACQILGLAGAAEAAVQCIRDGLEEPSMIMPFLEPGLPFYDSIREEPVFIKLVEELETP